jgi:hypothetical protein
MNKEIETYVKLKYFPIKGDYDYLLQNIPAEVIKKLYDSIYTARHDRPSTPITYICISNLMFIDAWKNVLDKRLMQFLIEYHNEHGT